MKKNAIYLAIMTVIILGFSSFKAFEKWQAPPEANKLVNPLKNNEKATKKGAKIYNNMCWGCHGKNGIGDGPSAKALNPKPANHTSVEVQEQTDGAIYWKLSVGRGAMPGYSKILSKTERWELVNYIRKLGNK